MIMPKTQSRIQKKNQAAILAAGLDVFSQYGFRGSTLDQIAEAAGLSKPNILYYFASKEDIYITLLARLLDDWMKPVYEINPAGDPVEEILKYAKLKLEMSRLYPAESRLFANEIIQGAPRIGDVLSGELRNTMDSLAMVIDGWVKRGKIQSVHPHHLFFSIWSMTQHYADFAKQIHAVLGDEDPFPGAEAHLEATIRRMLTPL
jgi:TetR/AcrR family transcriptional regulator